MHARIRKMLDFLDLAPQAQAAQKQAQKLPDIPWNWIM
jgi:hypothetical protein